MTRTTGILALVLALLPPILARAADSLPPPPPAGIVCPAAAPGLDLFAARELRRLVYLRTGQLLPIQQRDTAAALDHSAILVASAGSVLGQSLSQNLHFTPPPLASENYWIKTATNGGNQAVLVIGGDPVGTLYGAYRLAEDLGIRFYVEREVVPDERVPLQFPALDETAKPLFRLRGILPFHDFPEGPDWWERDDYLAVLAQLPKLRMNFFGLHTYSKNVPNGELLTGSEPTVWVGLPADVGAAGRVKAGYASGYYNTSDTNWGYFPKKTGAFSCGAAALFERDDYAVDLSSGNSSGAANAVFTDAGALLRDSFAFAHKLGIKTCVGTEAPLPVPKEVEDRLLAKGRDPWVPATTESLYEGMFDWITNTYPLDYYWLWTPERWTWHPVGQEEVSVAVDDLEAALAAWKHVKPPFSLATAGWVMGPQQDRTLFDKLMPKDVAISCINSLVGYTPVDPGFAKVKGRSKWEISWLEDDQALTAPQLWAARTRRDAFDALRYGCDGLMGIHWRTRELDPAFSALAQAAWSQAGWSAGWPAAATAENDSPPVKDFYLDWAAHEFGEGAGAAAAEIFSRLDGHTPRPADWLHGPGCVKVETNSWEEVSKDYTFVDEFAALAPRVKGAGNRDRYDWWLKSFQYARGMARVSCIWTRAYNAVVYAADATNAAEGLRLAREVALPLRRELITNLTEVYGLLLATVSNPGELGTIANWEQHIFPMMLNKPAAGLQYILGENLPADAQLPRNYSGSLRLIVPTVRTSFYRGEKLSLKVLVLSADPPPDPVLHWRPLGRGEYQEAPVQHIARGVYRAAFPAGAATVLGLEYYLTVGPANQPQAIWPPTAPETGQTLSAMER
jgi:hypothetical protein